MDLDVLTKGTITDCLFSGNKSEGTVNTGATGEGGAIATYNADFYGGSPLTVSGCTLIGNEAIGGSGGTTASGGPAIGGAIESYGGVLNLNSDAFSFNEALGGSSPIGASFAVGGAVNSNSASLLGTSTISDSLFTGNQAITGTGGGIYSFTAGSGAGDLRQPLHAEQHQLPRQPGRRQSRGQRRRGTVADGGAIWNTTSTMSIQGGLIAGNGSIGGRGGNATGAPGGAGGNGVGGGIANLDGGTVTLDGTTISGNAATGGAGGKGTSLGAGGDGLGGAINVNDTSTLGVTGGSIIGNAAIGGSGGGDGEGGGVYNSGTAAFSGVLIALNSALGGPGGGQGVGGGLYIAARRRHALE